MFVYVNIHGNTYVQVYEVEDRGIENPANHLAPKRWETAIPQEAAL